MKIRTSVVAAALLAVSALGVVTVPTARAAADLSADPGGSRALSPSATPTAGPTVETAGESEQPDPGQSPTPESPTPESPTPEGPTPTPTVPTPAPTPTVPTGPLSLREKALALDAGGHRGQVGKIGRVYADENSICSARKAIAGGADTVEFDMQETSDHGCVLMHDNTTGRTATRNVVVRRQTQSYLSRIRLRHNGRIPTCSAFLKAMRPYRDRISLEGEIKPDNGTKLFLSRMARLFKNYGFTGKAGNSRRESFSVKMLRQYHRYDASTPLDLISNKAVSAQTIDKAGLSGAIIPYEELVRAVHKNRKFAQYFTTYRRRLVPWKVDSVSRMRWVLRNSTMPRHPETGEADNRYGLAGFISDRVSAYQSIRRQYK